MRKSSKRWQALMSLGQVYWWYLFCLFIDADVFALSFEQVTTDFIGQHCVGCHGEDKQKGDVRLDTIGHDFSDIDNALLWQDVVDMINLGDMPPEEEPRPDLDVAKQFISVIQTEIDQAARNSIANTSYLMRRLSHTALNNTVRDLLGIPVDLAKNLPLDPEVDGFGNMSQTMDLSSEFMAQIQSNAHFISKNAMTSIADLRKRRVYDVDQIAMGKNVEKVDGFYAAFSSRSIDEVEYGIWPDGFVAPFPGIYTLSVDMFAKNNRDQFPDDVELSDGIMRPGLEAGEILDVAIMAAKPNSASWYRDDDSGTVPMLVPHKLGRLVGRAHISRELERYTIQVKLKQGEMVHVVFASLQPHNKIAKSLVNGQAKRIGEALYINHIEVEGPIQTDWPSKAYTMLVNGDKKLGRRQARKRIRHFLTQSFRRPVSKKELSKYYSFYRQNVGQLGVLGSMRLVVELVLCSPQFLMNYDIGGQDSWALANRLSYFLWNSMPDRELFKLAESGKLKQADVLRSQVRRMLENPKSEGFIDDFTSQWLGLKHLGEMRPDRRRFPNYNNTLEEAMRMETQLFFREILASNLSIRHFIDSDFTMLNQPLADHYGMFNVKGEQFRRVILGSRSSRGGLLGQASILTLTSDGIRTSPVKRGVWVLERLLGTPPNPPPPDVEPIEPDIRGASTVRETLAMHREIETCHECHRSIDPWGFALENFDPVGAWREHYGGYAIRDRNDQKIVLPKLAVDSSVTMAGGAEVNNFKELKAYLMSKEKHVALALTQKLMAYALGYQAGQKERYASEQIIEQLVDQHFPLADLITLICLSEPFLQSDRTIETSVAVRP